MRLFCLLPPLLAAGVLNAQEQVPHVARIEVSRWAASLGLERLESGEGPLRLTGARELELEAGRRLLTVDGLKVFTGWPIGGTDAEPDLAVADAERVLAPLIQPRVENSVRAPGRIVLDPGHGGEDSGARSTTGGLVEKQLNLDLARRLKVLLERRGHEVLLTRDADVFLALPDRPAFANAHGADLFLSLHFNALPGEASVRGIETFVLTPEHAPSTSTPVGNPGFFADQFQAQRHAGNLTDRANVLIGFAVHRRIVQDLDLEDRGLKRARFAVLRDLRMPGVLIEGGFLTNEEDVRLIRSEGWMDKLASAIADAVGDYAAALRAAGVSAEG